MVEIGRALRFEIFKNTEIFPEYFMKYFKIKKYRIFCITNLELTLAVELTRTVVAFDGNFLRLIDSKRL